MNIPKNLTSLVLFYALVIVNQFYLIPVQVINEGSDPVYPYLLNGLLLFLLLCLTAEAAYSHYIKKSAPELLKLAPKNIARIIALLGFVTIWAIMLESMGFIIPTLIFLGITTWLYGERSLRTILLTMFIGSFLLYFVFSIFGVALPRAELENFLWQLPDKLSGK